MTAEARRKTGLVPCPVFCMIEAAYRSRTVAEAVAAGRFRHVGITVELGVEPDWLTASLPADEEWRIEWSKFYYGLDLAQAYRATGDRKYLWVWERLISSWIRQVPVDYDPSDVAARRIQNWIYAWNLFASAPHFDGLAEGLDEQIIVSLICQVSRLRNHLTDERNHRTLELYALFIASLALPQIDSEGSLLKFAIDELYLNLLDDVREDGVHCESSTHYHMTVLRSFIGARENVRKFHLALPDGYDERLERACEFAMNCHRPDGLIPALSDSDTGCYADVLRLAASLFSRLDFLYAATGGAEGVAPRQRYVSFAEGGYFIQRSGWGAGRTSFRDEHFLIFDCGPLGDGGHGHYDLLNLELAANGRPLVIDPGRYTYAEQEPNWRRWFKSTAAHNTVSVDGLDQTPYRRGKPKGKIAQGRLIERLSAPDFDVLVGEAVSPAYEVVHTRRIFFIAGQYWIIADHLRGEWPHRFDLRFHLTPQAQGHVTVETQANNTVAHTPDLAFVFDSAHEFSIESGWVAPVYGTKLPAPVINVSVDGASQADFYTLVVPLKSPGPMPTLQVRSHSSGPNRSLLFEVSQAEPDRTVTDLVGWSETCETFACAPFQCRASAVWLRRSGEQVNLSACNVKEITWSSSPAEPLVRQDQPARWMTWDDLHGITIEDGRPL